LSRRSGRAGSRSSPRARSRRRRKKEATRDGAPPIDLIDGERLCDLLKEHQLGVRTTLRTIEDVEVNSEFFATLTA